MKSILKPLPKIIPVLGAPSWSPAKLSNLALWLRSDSGLYQDTGKLTPASSDGDVVGAWEDLSGNGNHGVVHGGTPAQDALAEAQARTNLALAERAQAAEQPGEVFAVTGHEPTRAPGATVIRFYVVQTVGADWGVYDALADDFQEQAEPLHDESEGHQGDTRPGPGQQCTFRCKQDSWIA